MSTIAKPKTFAEVFELTDEDLRDPFLQVAQLKFDAKHYDKRFTLESNGTSLRDAKVDHIGKHVSNTLQKIRNLESNPGNIDLTRIARFSAFPNTAFARTQLANTLGYDLVGKLADASTTSTSLTEAKDLIIDALPFGYTEPFERQAPSDADKRYSYKHRAIPALHMANLILANYFEADPQQEHLALLARNADTRLD